MKLKTTVFLFLVVCALFLSTTSAENPYLDPLVTTHELVAEKTFNGFTTSWYYSPGLTNQEYIIAIQNLEDVNRETNITSLISNTNFNLYEMSNILFEEYKSIPHTYTIDHHDEIEYSEWDTTNQTWVYWTEQFFNYTETIEDEKLDWKPCKMKTFSQSNSKIKENYGDVLIPKYDSKDKGDGTINGIKIFKLTFDTPITNTPDGFGSVGRVALLLNEDEHCPYWSPSWSAYSTVTMNATAPEIELQISITSDDFTIPLAMWNEMNQDGNDSRILNYNHTIEFPFWIEHLTARDDYKIWVNVTDNTSATYQWYYGNPSASITSNGYATFINFDDFEDVIQGDWTTEGGLLDYNNTEETYGGAQSMKVGGQVPRAQASITQTAGSEYNIQYQLYKESECVIYLNLHGNGINAIYIKIDDSESIFYYDTAWQDTGTDITPDDWELLEVRNIDFTAGTYDIYLNNIIIQSAAEMYIMVSYSDIIWFEGSAIYGCDFWVDNFIIRKYNINEPIVTDISEPHFYADSLHYNSTTPYNFTIELDGTLTSNRSIISEDDTNDTTQSTGDSYLIINIYNNIANTVRNFSFMGDNLDWYQAANLSGSYDLKNSSGIIETQSDVGGLVNFTTNLTSGTYWITESGILISLVSFAPSPLYTNYTGEAVISYMVQSTDPLNFSSLAFLYGLNYTITGDMHNYIGVPQCDIGYEGIYRAPNRNVTPYLSWEFNDTITEGNVWQWGGGDNNSWWIEKNQINATHTYINATGVTQHILPSSFYIQKLAMYNAPKTGFEINRQQGLIFKIWNVEQLRDRNFNYFANMYFDTSWESTLPTYPIEIGFCNNSYNPAVDDIDTCLNCTKFGEWDGTRWVNHSWVPGPNASYADPLIVNGSQYTEPIPDEINYIWQRSNTISSKSYVINATNYDPGITNISFAETNTMWTYNELNGVTTPVAYTPSFFTTFVRNDEELLHHLYIADDTGAWGHSEIFNESIGISSIPVSPVSFEYFNVTCDEAYHDHEMDATYDQGAVGVGIYCPADPDGTIVSHNLTLHYYPNMTLVAVINNTFTTTGVEDVEIKFTTTPYYSSDTLYTLKCESKDGDDNVATKWLISYFALDADGNQGWVKDDKLLFWGMNDIPTLYTEVNNNSLISYDGGSDIYTMHVPFFKSKGNDTYYFNESVHLESLNNEDVAYFRFTGRILFDDATILGWNTTTDTAAPITDEYRSYVYSLTMACGNITNSNFSYLGGDFYRQEGLNFIENSHEYLIHNSVFSHNAEGPIFEECSNFTISNCTISDNVNVGLGIYFSDNFIIENNTISSNGGRSITMYESNNNIISYNDITNSGIHGVHYWSNSQNNTCTGNDITGSALYDYYLSSSSTGNYIINPASITDRIRVTSTSSVNIENTDNAVFSEDSLNTSYAYLTNFSMYVSSVSQTFDITQRDMTILPSTNKVSIWNLEWDTSVKFNATSDIDINPTWFNITKSTWSDKTVYIYRNDTLYTNETANATGALLYNYSESLTEKWFEFRTTLISLGVYVPLSIFMFMGILLFVFAGASFYFTGVFSIFTSLLSVMFAFIMSKIAINGTLIQNIGGFDSTGTVIQAVTIIEMPALSYILLFIGLFMVVILIIQVMREIEFRKSKDIIELDL